MRSDIRYALRSLRRSPGFSVAATVTIALAVGVNTGVFSVLNGLLLRDLPANNADELVSIYQKVEGVEGRRSGGELGLFTTPEYLAYRDRTRSLAGILGHSDPSRATLGGESPQETTGLLVTCNYFDVLGTPPALGRSLTETDCSTGAEPAVVLGHELWRTAFAADPAVIGRTVELNRQPFAVVGVAAAGTYGGFVYDSAFFAPYSTQPLLLPDEDGYANAKTSWLFLVGRRGARQSLEQTRAELTVIAREIDALEPGRSTTLEIARATPFSLPFLRAPAVAVGSVVMTAFGLVLLTACANVANLLLARGAARSRDIALRLSLGASRASVVRQLLTESLLIAFAGGALGALIGLWSFRALLALVVPSFAPVGIPPLVIDASPDARVLGVTIALTLATGVVFGLAPALRTSRPDLHAVLKQDSSGGDGRGGGRMQAVLVGAQVAFCMLLVTTAGLLLRGLQATQTPDPGFVYRGVAVVAYDLAAAGYDRERASAMRRELLERVAALPGVERAALAAREPLRSGTMFAMSRLPAQEASRRTELNSVTPGYFATVGIPIVRGRGFSDADLSGDAAVAIVTGSTARNYWPREDPIGRTLLLSLGPDRTRELRVVGVANDAQVSWLGEVDDYYVYLPAGPATPLELRLLVSSRVDFGATSAAIRAAVRALDPSLAIRVTRLEENLDWSRRLSAIVSSLATTLGALALALAAVGVYGVVAYFSSLRVREIGIRIALGARAHDVVALLLRRTLLPVAIGAVVGLLAALGAGQVLSSVLFGISPRDAAGLGLAASFVLGVALAAAMLAAHGAVRADPVVSLRLD